MAAVSLRAISKRFGDVRALQDVDLEVKPGTIHAIVGENGAGKTTLMKVLYGALRADAGELHVHGQRREFRSAREAIAAGIGMVSQHYGIVPELTALQNLVLGAEGGALLHPSRDRGRADALAAKLRFQFRWDEMGSEMSPAQAQKLEILKLLWREAKILILDEPTAMLSPEDGEALFGSLKELVAEGSTVLLVTHRLPEVLDHCSRVTVLRGGRRVADMAVRDTTAADLVQAIVGEMPPTQAPSAAPACTGAPRLRVRGLNAQDASRKPTLRDVSLDVFPGEVVGIAGVDGSGQRELIEAILKVRPVGSGTLELDGEAIVSTKRLIEQGVRLIPEDRLAQGVVESWSLVPNAILGLERQPVFVRGLGLDRREAETWAERVASLFQTKHGGLRSTMGSLSGGNQQRFVAGRALAGDARLVLAFQPARGLDLKGTAEVYAALRAHAQNGGAALVVSFDLDELIEHCDRIVAMHRGRLEEIPADQTRDRAAIGRRMVGAT